MAAFLVYATENNQRGSSGRNAALVDAASASAARTAIIAASLDGGLGNVAAWSAEQVGDTASGVLAASGVIWLGDVSEPLVPHRGT